MLQQKEIVRYGLEQATFLIPLRIESADRMRNIITTLIYLCRNFKTNIIVYELDQESIFKSAVIPQLEQALLPEEMSMITHIFEKSDDYTFHRTRLLNDMAIAARTPVVVNYDSDILLPQLSYIKAVDFILNGYVPEEGGKPEPVKCVYPYGCGVYQYQVDYSMELFEKFVEKDHDIMLLEDSCRMESSTIGWTQFYSKDAVIKGGMWNENFISWGAEDCEFYFRFNILGFKVGRLKNALWHFEHGRTQNSHYHNPKFRDNHELWQRLRNSTRDQVISYYNSQPYLKERYASL